MKTIIATIAMLLIAAPAYAAGYLLPDPANQTAQGISGADAGGRSEVIKVTDGALHITEPGMTPLDPTSGLLDIPSAGATDRVQMTALAATACTLQAPDTNSGIIYVGDSAVTNASGAKAGIELPAGSGLSNISVANLNLLYVAADTAGDDVKYICN